MSASSKVNSSPIFSLNRSTIALIAPTATIKTPDINKNLATTSKAPVKHKFSSILPSPPYPPRKSPKPQDETKTKTQKTQTKRITSPARVNQEVFDPKSAFIRWTVLRSRPTDSDSQDWFWARQQAATTLFSVSVNATCIPNGTVSVQWWEEIRTFLIPSTSSTRRFRSSKPQRAVFLFFS